MTDELKPCPNPWCGSPRPPFLVWDLYRRHVQCVCGVRGPSSDHRSLDGVPHDVLEAEAITAWNTRADLATPTPAMCCLGLAPEQCAHTPSSQCEGLRPAVKVKALVWEPDDLGWKAKGAAKEYTVYRESQKRTADADNRERILVWIEEPNSTLSQSATPLDDPRVKALESALRDVIDEYDRFRRDEYDRGLSPLDDEINDARAILIALEENK